MTANKDNTVQALEHGNLYFFYRPRVEEDSPESAEDVQRLYMVLSPEEKKRYRLVVVGRKKLPDPSKSGRRQFWCFVDKVTNKPDSIEEKLEEQSYSTKTRGKRHAPAARPAGEGVYCIARHDDHTHFAYALELPKQPQDVQEELGIEEEASYIISVKNPEKASPRAAGLSEEDQPDYPKRLEEVFRGRRFSEADPPDFLDHQGTEFILAAASDELPEEFETMLEPESETQSNADIFRDLRLKKSEHPLEPLFKGKWE